MVDANSNKLFEQNSFANYGKKNNLNVSILSSKPPLLDVIKNNFNKIIGLNSPNAPKSGVLNNMNLFALNIRQVDEPKSSEVKLDSIKQPTSAIKKPPMFPKYASPNKSKKLFSK